MHLGRVRDKTCLRLVGLAPTTVSITSPVTSVAGTATGGGYLLTTALGRVLSFGNAKKPTPGTLPAIHVTPGRPIIGAVWVGSAGYWLIGADGGIFGFGTAPFVGSLPGLTPPVAVNDIVGAVRN